MNCREFEDILNDFMDGHLSSMKKKKAEAHLERCPDCRESLEQHRGLIAEARALPKSVAPRRDLWPDILDRLQGPGEAEPAVRRPGFGAWWNRFGLLAAAAVIIAIISVILATTFFMEREDPLQQVEKNTLIKALPASMSPEEIVMAEKEYRMASEKLLQVLDERGDSLSPETLRVVQENIRLIDAAIREIKGALDKDPANPKLNQLLLATYQRQLKLLKQATALPPRTSGRGTGFILRDSANSL